MDKGNDAMGRIIAAEAAGRAMRLQVATPIYAELITYCWKTERDKAIAKAEQDGTPIEQVQFTVNSQAMATTALQLADQFLQVATQ